MGGSIDTLMGFYKKNFGFVSQPNQFSKPFKHGGVWDYSARGTYSIDEDEFLLVTVKTKPGQFLGFQVADLWTHKVVEYVASTGSLNNKQAETNIGGTSITFAISRQDPGIKNWLDIGGLHNGEFLIRWENLNPDEINSAVPEIKLVKLSELNSVLPKTASLVTAEQRKVLNAQRELNYKLRYRWL